VACNLKCKYCWFNPLDQSKVELMPPELLEKLVQDYARADDSGSYQFIWHGGEPLMAGRQFFETALELQEKYMPDSPVKNVIQTNGTMLTQEWASFFAEHKFKVGVSIDGPKELHDSNRITPRGLGSHERIMENLVRARELGLRFSVIATISKANVECPDQIFRFFADNAITSFGFNMVFELDPSGKPMPYSISNDEYANFQNQIFDLWLLEDDSRIRVRHIDSIIHGMLGLPVRSCIYAGTCERFLSISSNGDVYPCERLTDSARLGNLYEKSMSAIVASAEYGRHSQMTRALPQDCQECRFLRICRNGCTHHRTSGKLYFCEGRKAVFTHIEKALGHMAAPRSPEPITAALSRHSNHLSPQSLCR
jgi:uncharacterized protein